MYSNQVDEMSVEFQNDPNSPIIQKFLNGKNLKQDWEAIVKIPFIDQARLLN
jgi:5'-3' exonuclease